MDDTMTIGQLARRSGVPATTLRYYDRIGLLSPQRLGNNYRRYRADDLQRIEMIQLCQGLGCSLDEVALVLAPEAGAVRRALARRKLREIDDRMRALTVARAVLEHAARCRHTAMQAQRCRAVAERAARSVEATEGGEIASVRA